MLDGRAETFFAFQSTPPKRGRTSCAARGSGRGRAVRVISPHSQTASEDSAWSPSAAPPPPRTIAASDAGAGTGGYFYFSGPWQKLEQVRRTGQAEKKPFSRPLRRWPGKGLGLRLPRQEAAFQGGGRFPGPLRRVPPREREPGARQSLRYRRRREVSVLLFLCSAPWRKRGASVPSFRISPGLSELFF